MVEIIPYIIKHSFNVTVQGFLVYSCIENLNNPLHSQLSYLQRDLYILVLKVGFLRTDLLKNYHIRLIFIVLLSETTHDIVRNVKKALGFTYIKYSWYIESDTTRKAIVVSSKTLVHVFCCCVCLVLLCLETNFGNLVVIANLILFMNVARLP